MKVYSIQAMINCDEYQITICETADKTLADYLVILMEFTGEFDSGDVFIEEREDYTYNKTDKG